jgi:NAD+ kinase
MLPEIIAGKGWIEERIMLESSFGDEVHHCLNDVVVRGATSRLVNVTVYIDDQESMTYRADGMIIATATGSTGYSLAAGGPILNPQSSEFILNPICCHLGPNTALVLSPDSNVQLTLAETDKALLVIDGQIEIPISAGQSISIKRSPRITRFLRLRQRGYFYKTLWQNLKLPGAS